MSQVKIAISGPEYAPGSSSVPTLGTKVSEKNDLYQQHNLYVSLLVHLLDHLFYFLYFPIFRGA